MRRSLGAPPNEGQGLCGFQIGRVEISYLSSIRVTGSTAEAFIENEGGCRDRSFQFHRTSSIHRTRINVKRWRRPSREYCLYRRGVDWNISLPALRYSEMQVRPAPSREAQDLRHRTFHETHRTPASRAAGATAMGKKGERGRLWGWTHKERRRVRGERERRPMSPLFRSRCPEKECGMEDWKRRLKRGDQ